EIAQRANGIFSLSSLHAKVYIVDRVRALVTSANATYSGMYRNRECGFELTASTDVQSLADLVSSGFGATPKPQRWSVSDLEELPEPVKALRDALPRIPKSPDGATESPVRVNLRARQFHRLLDTLPGWTQLTLEGVSLISSDVFTMEQVWTTCAPLVAARFP